MSTTTTPLRSATTLTTPNRTDIRLWIANESRPALSLHMPLRAGGAHDDVRRFEGHVREARKQLERILEPGQLEPFLAPVIAVAESIASAGRIGGISVFRSRAWFGAYACAVPGDEVVLVSNKFLVRPILRSLQSNLHYFLLDLSQKHVSLFAGDESGLRPLSAHVSGAPTDAHLAGSGGKASGAHETAHNLAHDHVSLRHTQGTNIEHAGEEDLLRFLRVVAADVKEALRDANAPLIVAAPHKLLALYERANRYPHLLHEGIHGSFADARPADLHAKAWPIVQAFAKSRESEVLESYKIAVNRDLATDDLPAIAQFAAAGRVRVLLVDAAAHQWGTMDPTGGAVELHTERAGPEDGDVLDALAESVLLHGGEVETLPTSKLPSRSPAAAILRW